MMKSYEINLGRSIFDCIRGINHLSDESELSVGTSQCTILKFYYDVNPSQYA